MMTRNVFVISVSKLTNIIKAKLSLAQRIGKGASVNTGADAVCAKQSAAKY